MKKLNHPVYIVVSGLVLTLLVFEIFQSFDESESRKEVRSLVASLSRVSSLRLGEGPRYLREIGYVRPWLKEDIARLAYALKKNHEIDLLNSEQIVSILNALILAGRSAASATSTVSLYIDNDNEDVRWYALRALLAFKSVPESVSNILEKDCTRSILECASREVLLRELESNESQEPLSKQQMQRYRELARSAEENALKILSRTETKTAVVSTNLISCSLFAEFLSPSFLKELLDAFSKTKDLEIKRSILLTLTQFAQVNSDNVEREKIIKWISKRMQYDSEYRVRELAAIVLSRIGTPDSISEVKAYGHKIAHGDTFGPVKEPHPFVEWGRKVELNPET